MIIEHSLHKLVDAFQNGSNNSGEVIYSRNEVSIHPITPPLNGEILYFYRHLILRDIPIVGGTCYLIFIESNKLLIALEGWRIPCDTNDWSDNYIIFAERNGDVLFCDLQDINSPVYSSIQKRNRKIADSMGTFLNVYSTIIELESTIFNYNTMDDDFNIIPDFISAVRNELDKKLTGEQKENFIHFFFG
ncbi:hypothetical protein ACNENL_003969 [Escherichia fergusonii]